MAKIRALPILLLVALSLLLPLPLAAAGNIVASSPGPVSENKTATPLMSGLNLTSWDGQRPQFSLQIEALLAVPKVMGGITLINQTDLKATNCALKTDRIALADALQEITQLLAYVGHPFNSPAQTGQTLKLLQLPPKFAAAPFACHITHPGCREILIRADQAAFRAGQNQISLEGNVQVHGDKFVRLAAEKIEWSVTTQEFQVQGDYIWQANGREIRGKNDCFLLSDAGLRRTKANKSPTPPPSGPVPESPVLSTAGQTPLPTPNFLLMPAAGKGNLFPIGNVIMAQLQEELHQIQSSAANSLGQRRREPRLNEKPTVYPRPDSAHSLEESVVRELLSEKSYWYCN